MRILQGIFGKLSYEKISFLLLHKRTYLKLFFHIVTVNVQTLVVSDQLFYTFFIETSRQGQYSKAFFTSSLDPKHLPPSSRFMCRNQCSRTVPSPGCKVDDRTAPNEKLSNPQLCVTNNMGPSIVMEKHSSFTEHSSQFV